jgi:hypothetical protein
MSRLWMNHISKFSQKNLVNDPEVNYFVNDQEANYFVSHKYIGLIFNILVFLLMTIAVYVIKISRLLHLISMSKSVDLFPFECLFLWLGKFVCISNEESEN